MKRTLTEKEHQQRVDAANARWGRPRVTVLVGPPGVGKSTWTAKSAPNAEIISTDAVIDAYARKHGLTYTEAFDKVDHKKALAYAMDRFRSALAEGKDVVIDRTNMSRRSRERFLSEVPPHYERHAVVFELPREELNRRLAHRANTTGKVIPKAVVDGMLKDFERPDHTEFDAVISANRGRVVRQERITRVGMRANPDKLYVFGDNLEGWGFGGQAKEMRHEPNALGIPTKRSPRMDAGAFFQDADLEYFKTIVAPRMKVLRDHIDRGGTVVVPADGIGTGLAQLPRRAPKIWAYLKEELDGLTRDRPLAKRTPGAPLSEAEVQQRRDAAKARWAAASAGVGAVAGGALAVWRQQKKRVEDRASTLRNLKGTRMVAGFDRDAAASRERTRVVDFYSRRVDRIDEAAERAGEQGARRPALYTWKETQRTRSPLQQLGAEMAGHEARGLSYYHERGADPRLAALTDRMNDIAGRKRTPAQQNLLQRARNEVQEHVENTIARSWPERLAQDARSDTPTKVKAYVTPLTSANDQRMKAVRRARKNRAGQLMYARRTPTATHTVEVMTTERAPIYAPDVKRFYRRFVADSVGTRQNEAQKLNTRLWEQAEKVKPAQAGRRAYTSTISEGLKNFSPQVQKTRFSLKSAGKAAAVGAVIGGGVAAGAYLLARRYWDQKSRPVAKSDDANLAKAAGKPEDEMAQRLARMFGKWKNNPQDAKPEDADEAFQTAEEMFRAGAEANDQSTDYGGRRAIVRFSFGQRNPAVAEAAAKYRSELVRGITQTQAETIRQALVTQELTGNSVETTGRRIRESIGLTPYQAQNVSNYRLELEHLHSGALNRALRDKRFDGTVKKALESKSPLTEEQVNKMVDAYHRRYLALRAMTIARTESVRAANLGAIESARQQLDAMPDMTVVKTWMATKDNRTRPDHRELDGKAVVGLDTPFVLADGSTIRYPHDEQAPADQVCNCRCTFTLTLVPRQEAVRQLMAEEI